jgi:GNAT superfamily N-acetyltransferase
MIRAATEADYPDVIAMGRKFYEALPYLDIPYSEASAARWLNLMRDQGALLIAESGGAVVGMAGALFSQFIFNDQYRVGAELMWWIEPAFRAEGIGSQLLEALEKAAYDAGCVRWSMIAVIDGTEERIGKLYERCGYTQSERTFVKVLHGGHYVGSDRGSGDRLCREQSRESG